VPGAVRLAYAARRVGRRGLLVPVGLLVLFALLVGLRVHGFSLAAWHDVIDGSPATEVWLGVPRPIRSDDWKAELPLAFAQVAHRPPLPVENDLIGLGQSALVPLDLPVAHPLVLFRPTLWGFFLGDDAGMAWMWWARVLGLFGIWLGVFGVVTGGRRALSAAGAAWVTFAPFFQFWSFNAAPVTAAGGAAFLATVALARARRPFTIVASGLGLGAAGAWLALVVYPPYQVTLGWLGLALVAGFWLDTRRSLDLRRHGALRALALAGGGLLAVAVLAWFVWAARDAIAAMQHTVYPGRRIATGGERSLAELANATLAAGWWSSHWGRLENICEAASFWMLAPVAVAAWLWRSARGEPVDAFALPLGIYWLVMGTYVVAGLPAWLTRATGLSLVPGSRAVLGLGLADALLVVRFLAVVPPFRPRERLAAAGLSLAWAAGLAACGLVLRRELPDARLALLLPLAAANGALAWTALASRRRALPALALAAASFVSAGWFNPVAVGGARWLRENALSREIVAVDRAAGGDTTWAAFGRDDLADLFRVLGVHSVNGLQPTPQLALWRRIDPGGRARRVYDRYAHVAFVAAPGATPRFRLYSRDFVILTIDPSSPALRALGVTHVLFRGSPAERAAFEAFAGLEPLASVGDNHLYRVPRELPSAAGP
jgi:hypothetical protein